MNKISHGCSTGDHRRVLGLFLATTLWLGLLPAFGAVDSADLVDLELEALLEVEVTSVTRRPQRLSEAAAAIYVVTQEDIIRSGATSIPDALRMVPGLHVAQIDANKWAISARGFNGRFANKLLVLMDGRVVYTPAFSGVYWDVQDTVLDDVKRIEVIRGPGATMWGANAVNGVINVITMSAAETQEGAVVVGAGNVERGFGTVRYGGTWGEDFQYRAFGKYFNRQGSYLDFDRIPADDQWDAFHGGLRVDWPGADPARSNYSLQANVYSGSSGSTSMIPMGTPPATTMAPQEEKVSGANLMFTWQGRRGDSGGYQFKTFVDSTSRDALLAHEDRDNLAAEFEQYVPLGRRNELVWGAGLLVSRDQFVDTPFSVLAPDSLTTYLWSAFVQDEIRVVPERLALTIGSKFEHNDFTGFEYQPNVRLAWIPRASSLFWGSVARAVRTPSRGERSATISGLPLGGVLPPGSPDNPFPVPMLLAIVPSEEFGSEEMIAYELGYRTPLGPKASLDVATFWNEYDELRSAVPGLPRCEPSGAPVSELPPCFLNDPYVVAPSTVANGISGNAKGFEISADYRPTETWRLQGAYSRLRTDLEVAPGQTGLWDHRRFPENQFNLRSWLTLRQHFDVDVWLRYVDEIPVIEVQDYVTLDLRLAWRFKESFELQLVGQNLVEDDRLEFVSLTVDAVPTQVSRSWYVAARWWF